jgi:hypothetical protein
MIEMASSRPSENVAEPRDPAATTWAEVSRKPSDVIATAEPVPAGWYPALVPTVRRRAATEGPSRSATPVTTRL